MLLRRLALASVVLACPACRTADPAPQPPAPMPARPEQRAPADPTPAEVPPAQPPAPPEPPAVAPEPAAPADAGKPPALVDPKRLEALIPSSVGSWTRVELRSVVAPTGDGDVAQADGVFMVGGVPPTINVSILDTRGFAGPQSMFRVMHDKGGRGITNFEQAGEPSLEQFWPRPLNTVLMTLVDDRFLILISGEGSDQPTVRKVLDAIDIAAIAALK